MKFEYLGCHLHDLIEAVRQEKIMLIDPIDDEIFFNILDSFNSNAARFICFDMGELKGIPDIKPIYELVKAPFPECWFEHNFIHTDGTQIILGMAVIVREKTQITFFRRKHHKWMVRGLLQVDKLSTWQEFAVYPNINIVGEELRENKLVLSTFLSALHCNNVKQIEHKPEIKTQKIRQKRGKLPFFSYWTLELILPKASTANKKLNGTHVSPRIHLRRGHPRQYKPGKWTWINNCIMDKKQIIEEAIKRQIDLQRESNELNLKLLESQIRLDIARTQAFITK